MTTIAYLNGEYLPLEEAKISPLDRGFLFGDGVYEVIPVYSGRPFRLNEHLVRLEHSLQGIMLEQAIKPDLWRSICHELILQNGGNIDQSIYLQITRGEIPERNPVFANKIEATLFAYSKPFKIQNQDRAKAITLEDIRWKQCNIKAITLLPNVLLRQKAKEADALEAILINNGYVIEGTSSNVFLVKDGIIVTPSKGPQMLGGITRDVILELAQRHHLPYQERPVLEAELFAAEEVWITSSLREIQPITQIDEKVIGEGKIGALAQQMLQYYHDYKERLING